MLHNFIKEKPPVDILVKFNFKQGGMFLGKYQGGQFIRCHEAGSYYDMNYCSDLSQSELIGLRWEFVN